MLSYNLIIILYFLSLNFITSFSNCEQLNYEFLVEARNYKVKIKHSKLLGFIDFEEKFSMWWIKCMTIKFIINKITLFTKKIKRHEILKPSLSILTKSSL